MSKSPSKRRKTNVSRSKPKADEPVLIPAVAYVRKSTKGERADGSQKQEKSLAQQKTEITKLAAGRFKILDWFEDEGISGWKRGAQRPDFQRMIDGVKDLRAEAIICDNIDRFSRATIDDVQEDVAALRKAGIGRIVTANGGDFDLNAGRRNDLSGIIMFAAAVWASHEFSRNLGRRSALARRNTIDEGKRPGGRIPYAWVADGKHSLKFGDPAHVRIVRWIFDQFANKGQSLNWIAGQLNLVKKTPAPSGKEWYVRTLKILLANPVYVGKLVHGIKRNAQFFSHDDKGEIVDVEIAHTTEGKQWKYEKVYQEMVPISTFAKAQRRLTVNKTGRTHRKRLHALSGILYCSKCGKPLYGTRQHDQVIYRCSATQILGQGKCEPYQVREDQILPLLWKLLGEEVKDIQKLLTSPPPELVSPRKGQVQKHERLQKERDKLANRIANAVEAVVDGSISDPESRRMIDKRIITMRDELAQLDTELAIEPINKGYNRQELQALTTWWDEFNAKAVSVPVKAKNPGDSLLISFHRDWFAPDYRKDYDPSCEYVKVDPMAVNELLRQLEAKVTLSWKTIDSGAKRLHIDRNGKRRTIPSRQHVLTGGRLQLGQRNGKLPSNVLETKAFQSTYGLMLVECGQTLARSCFWRFWCRRGYGDCWDSSRDGSSYDSSGACGCVDG